MSVTYILLLDIKSQVDHCTCSGWRCRAGACWVWMPLGTCWRHVPKTPFLPVPVLDAATYASPGTHVKIASISCQMLCPTLIHTWLFASAQVFIQQTHFSTLLGRIYVHYFQKHASSAGCQKIVPNPASHKLALSSLSANFAMAKRWPWPIPAPIKVG